MNRGATFEGEPASVEVLPKLKTVTIELDLVEALSVGHSLRALAQRNPFPAGETAKIYRRVGERLVAAAHAKLVR